MSEKELKESRKKRICIFASGSGSNAEKIIHRFHKREDVAVAAVLTNNKSSPLISAALKYGVPSIFFTREELCESGDVERLLGNLQPDLLVLAGFLWLMPPSIVSKYSGRILNIHPALLPKFGGKGMYGMKVHEAVIRNGEQESGMTVHVIDEEYDKGKIIFQQKVLVGNMGPSELQQAVLQLEHRHYPEVIEKFLEAL